ncbi:hypothetical protein SAY87_008315 [Trapa incisa]|uniref:Rab-GAP TBC domain-containing protein n=1 Tax=Trapa incisa TaxID=236973 RepID=A0AAN7KL37_9MYRT|nr:hypothetical protein SAY87_008315 [Trapa incisa]
MVKKRVPDWLNNSLWYSRPPPDDERILRYASRYSDPEPTAGPPTPAAPSGDPPRPEIVDSARDRDGDGNGVLESPSAEEISRQSQLLAELSSKVVNMRELRRLASQGIPDGSRIRPVVWKLLLGYLPPDRAIWPSELAKKRSQYKNFKSEFLMNPSEITRRLEKSANGDNDKIKRQNSGLLRRSGITHGDHPLNLVASSIWHQFFQDAVIIEQIDRDVHRTHPDINFFSGDSQYAKSNQETLLRVCCAMLILVRRRLLAGDFTSNLKLLQHYPSTNINHLMYVASKLRSKHSG